MRYITVPTVDFTDATGKEYKIKDTYDLGVYEIATEISITKGVYLDEIAHSDIVYGDVAKTYVLFEANADRFIDANLDITNVDKIRIPKV